MPRVGDPSRPGLGRRHITHAGRVTINDAACHSAARCIPDTKGDTNARPTAAVNIFVIDSFHRSQRRRDKRFWF
jgi:hypothetical protein